MEISNEQVKELREMTGVSVMECKKALEAAGGDLQKALAVLRERAGAAVQKKADRALGAGTVAAYVHSGAQVGALVQLMCETDFVSKNEAFVALARDIAMHICAMRPTTTEELMGQPFVKDPSKTVGDAIADAVQRFGERTEVLNFSCFSVK